MNNIEFLKDSQVDATVAFYKDVNEAYEIMQAKFRPSFSTIINDCAAVVLGWRDEYRETIDTLHDGLTTANIDLVARPGEKVRFVVMEHGEQMFEDATYDECYNYIA